MKLLNSFIAIVAAIGIALGSTSCKQTPSWVNDTTVTTAISVGTKAGLTLVKDTEARTRAADYVDVGAKALRAIAVAPTPEGLADLIQKYIPDNVKQDYPEVIAFVVPIVVSNYKSFYDKYSGDQAKLIAYLGDVANGLEAGASSYITKH